MNPKNTIKRCFVLNKLIVILLVLISSSCAGKAKWRVVDVAPEKREWRWCDYTKDGESLDGKGICYISKKCIKKFLRKEKCKRVQLFCAHGDLDCLVKNKWPKVKKGK